jgi:hypothetical protein
MQPQPQLDTKVHYQAYGTPGGEHPRACWTATVTEVGQWVTTETRRDDPHDPPQPGERRTVEQAWDPEALALMVSNPTGLFFNTACRHDEADRAGGTWHWPESAGAEVTAPGDATQTRMPVGPEGATDA